MERDSIGITLALLGLRGMKQDFSWEKSAKKYVGMYESALNT
jgi:glycogen synthase